jgi:membrane protease YdiL (CAAX protease family)
MSEDFLSTLSFGVLALLLILMGVRKGFFKLSTEFWDTPIRFFHLIGAFAIYFIATYAGSNLAISFFRKDLIGNYVAYSSWLNFGLSFAIFLLLLIYSRCISNQVRKSILRRPGTKHPLTEDVGAALYAWIIAFPLVLFLSQFLELLIFKIFKVSQVPDQLAVKFLKSTFEAPISLILAVLSIVVLAPLIEETLFRGFLQSYIRKHLGSVQAIVITSACFSMFHYSAGQGLANLSIILPLFILSLFLGFLYEKQGSLLAPMTLHAAFNMVSVVNLYVFGGFTAGL